MSFQYESRDSAHSITSQMLFALLAGNLFAVLSVIAFKPFPNSVIDTSENLVLGVGVLTLISLGLLFLASAMRRGAKGWWTVTFALNIAQVGRLIPAVVAIAFWAEEGNLAGLFWAYLFVPFLGLLSAVGIVMTAREMRKSRRRRLARAA
jgi:hypothetical protein